MTRCPYFPDCGGCSYLNFEEEKYRGDKLKKLSKIFSEGDLLFDEKNFSVNWGNGNSFFKRRKAILQIDKENNIGFYAKNSRNLVKIDNCYVLEKPLSELIQPLQNLVKDFEQNLLTQIQITLFDNVIDVIFLTQREFNMTQNKKIAEFAKALKINASIAFAKKFQPIFIAQKLLLTIQQPPIELELSSQIFIQATKGGLQEIISQIRLNLEAKNKLKIADIYSGFGIYSFAISDLAKEICAFEGNAQMVDLIEKNVAKNNLKNKIKAQNRDLFSFPISWSELKDFDAAIINPPRNGASPQIREITHSQLKKLIYVSCNPESFARDALILQDAAFDLTSLVAIDQFYSTDHFELVGIFCRG